MRKKLFLLAVSLCLLLVTVHAEDEITSKSELNRPGRRIGISQGSAAEAAVMSEMPEAEIVYYTDNLLGYTAVAQGKLDAYVNDQVQMQMTIDSGLTGVHLLEETMDQTIDIAVGCSSVSQIPDLKNRLNQFIREMKADGTLDDMYRRWVLEKNSVMPGLPMADHPQLHLTVGTTGTVPPYSYYEGTGLTGYDIELAHRFAAWLGADVSIQTYDFSSIVPAAASGKIDVIMSNLQVLPERSESLPFSDVLYSEKMGIMVRDGNSSALSDASPDLSGTEAPQNLAYSTLHELNGRRIGVQTGTSFDAMVQKVLPEAQIEYYNGKADLVAALSGKKIDAFAVDEPVAQILMHEDSHIAWLPEYLDTYEFAFVFPKTEAGEQLRDQFNTFLRQLPEGTLDQLAAKWFGENEDAKTMPDITALSAENGTLHLATESGYAPFEYVRDGSVVGYDMDLAAMFCDFAGFGLEIVDMNFDGILPAIQAGKCDFAAAGINITPERAESVLFSDPNFSGGTVMVVWKQEPSNPVSTGDVQPEFTEFQQLSGKHVSMLTGAPFEELVKSRVPDVGKISYFSTVADLIEAVKSGKTDAFLLNNAVSVMVLKQNPELAMFPKSLQDGIFGFAFQKGDSRAADWQAARSRLTDAQIQAVWEKWAGNDESAKVLPAQDWPGLNGTVTVAACDTLEPISYTGGDGTLKGFDIEVLLMIARELDVHVNFTGMDFAAVLTSVQSGKADIGCGSIIVSDERKEAVDFVEYYPAAFVLIVRAAKPAEEEISFWSSIRDSFIRTFIRENRWQLFVQGILTTLLITVLSVLFGTLLGFGIFMMCRSGNPAANLCTRFSLWLIQGMPMVVLLMILYYVIFGSVAISGTAVAVIGFTLTFGASVFGLLKLGVGAVDAGQYEAAYALGYSSLRTFFRIILPQALPHVLPSYMGEISGLIKATAIVGYIAVQDLTKMGDIVRSRTYEAFFPLIAVTVIYFVLEGLISFLVGRVGVTLNPKHRKPERILKGIRTGKD